MSSDTPSKARNGTHFWFLVIEYEHRQGIGKWFFQGTVTPAPTATRQDIFEWALEQARGANPETAGGAVTAFDVQLNKLDRGADA